MYINTFKYTPKDVSCQLCTEYMKKLGCTSSSQSPLVSVPPMAKTATAPLLLLSPQSLRLCGDPEPAARGWPSASRPVWSATARQSWKHSLATAACPSA